MAKKYLQIFFIAGMASIYGGGVSAQDDLGCYTLWPDDSSTSQNACSQVCPTYPQPATCVLVQDYDGQNKECCCDMSQNNGCHPDTVTATPSRASPEESQKDEER